MRLLIDWASARCYEAENFYANNAVKTPPFEELKSLDLQKCDSVGDIVNAMRYCAFGARMLGEVANTIFEMATAKDKPLLIYRRHSGFAARIAAEKIRRESVVPANCAAVAVRARENSRAKTSSSSALSPSATPRPIYKKPARAIFINPFDMARPGQIRDGFFPDAVFADPRYVMPVIYAALDEWINGKPSSISAFISTDWRPWRPGGASGARRQGARSDDPAIRTARAFSPSAAP